MNDKTFGEDLANSVLALRTALARHVVLKLDFPVIVYLEREQFNAIKLMLPKEFCHQFVAAEPPDQLQFYGVTFRPLPIK